MCLISPALADRFFFLNTRAIWEASALSKIVIFCFFFFFDSSHLNGCEVISHCVFDLHFPTD